MQKQTVSAARPRLKSGAIYFLIKSFALIARTKPGFNPGFVIGGFRFFLDNFEGEISPGGPNLFTSGSSESTIYLTSPELIVR